MARRTDGGNAGNGFQSISSGRTDLKTASPGWCALTIAVLLIYTGWSAVHEGRRHRRSCLRGSDEFYRFKRRPRPRSAHSGCFSGMALTDSFRKRSPVVADRGPADSISLERAAQRRGHSLCCWSARQVLGEALKEIQTGRKL